MKIIIAGDGDTGTHLARQLSYEDQDVVLLGTDAARLADMDARYNILTQEGDATSASAMKAAGVAGADLFVAVTPWGNTNLVSAQLAKSLGAGKTVARIDNPEFISDEMKSLFRNVGVDTLVYPEHFAAKEISTALEYSWLRYRYSLHDGQIIVAGVRIPEGAPVDGMELREFGKERHRFHVSAIRRGGETIIPCGTDVIRARDTVWFTLAGGDEHELIRLCGRSDSAIRKVMVAGAGKIARTLCRRLGNRFELTAVEPDRERCRKLMECCRDVNVVNADYRNLDVLRDEKLQDMDAFVALTDASETNIVSCLVARDFGVRKTVAEIEDMQYLSEAERLDIDKVINKKLLTSSRIYQMLLDSFLPTPRCLALEYAEVVEIVAGEGSKIVKDPVKDLKLPKGTTIGGMIRDGVGMLVGGETRIRPGDHLVIFCLTGSLSKIEKFFV